MVQCVVPQNALASCEEMRSTVSALDRRESLVCPKPRRAGSFFGQAFNDPIRPLRWQLSSHQAELCDSKVELLDIILAKGGCGLDQMPSPVASSPPYFCGSPPSRAANPLVHDAHFGKEKLHSVSPLPIPSGLPSSPSSASASASASPLMGCARATFGLKPAAVRVEGFNCLERDRQNRSVSAVA
ncbi:hypothetical protein CKAN_01419500 [Cinnamomum micranthum f. kanehirae]|uniref:Uncharacterized protein n=1 Tax=Cinnamomum micranthum f. kanehirae TaxID=337451 RepID=A0A3S3MKG7_9MAGN|nr:hypothetical protein CKAN_01419500 [Cinnamomum micranthum f. kanehirae]